MPLSQNSPKQWGLHLPYHVQTLLFQLLSQLSIKGFDHTEQITYLFTGEVFLALLGMYFINFTLRKKSGTAQTCTFANLSRSCGCWWWSMKVLLGTKVLSCHPSANWRPGHNFIPPLMAMTFNQPKSTTAIRANKLYEQHTQCPLNWKSNNKGQHISNTRIKTGLYCNVAKFNLKMGGTAASSG